MPLFRISARPAHKYRRVCYELPGRDSHYQDFEHDGNRVICAFTFEVYIIHFYRR